MQAASGVDAALVERVRVDVTAAVSHVKSVWDGAVSGGARSGGAWSERVEVRVVADGAAVAVEAAGFAVGAGALDDVAAVAVVPTAVGGSVGASTAPGGETTGRATDSAGSSGRLVVNAEVYDRLSDVGGQVVTRHEVTHLASAAQTPPDLPVWLVEGFADAVARVGLADRPASAAVELAAEIEAGRVPAGLPADGAFAGADGRLAQTYQQAWLACQLVAERAGIDGLVRFYRAAGSGAAGSPPASPAPASVRLDAALRQVVDLDLPAFTSAWRDYLVDVLT